MRHEGSIHSVVCVRAPRGIRRTLALRSAARFGRPRPSSVLLNTAEHDRSRRRAANLCFACIQGGIHTDTSRYSITPFDDGCGLRRCSARTSDAPHAVWALGSMAHAAERARAKCQHLNPCPLSAAQRSMDGAVSVGGWWGGERAARLRLLPAAMRVRGRLNKSAPQG
jgi:hypothetical protein